MLKMPVALRRFVRLHSLGLQTSQQDVSNPLTPKHRCVVIYSLLHDSMDLARYLPRADERSHFV